jgi:mannosyltransferase
MMGVVTGYAGGPTASAPSQQPAARPVPARHVDGPAWVAIIPALITLAVTIYQIQRPSLWRDEGATLIAVHRSLPQLLHMLGHTDVVNGAYYTVMWFVTRTAGTSALALRFPSAVGMAVAAGVTAALGRRLVSARAGLAAGLVFAAPPVRGWLAASAAAVAVASPVIVISVGQRGEVSWLKRLDAAEVASTHQLLGPPALAVLVLLVIVATLAFCARRGRLAADMPSRLLALSLPWLLLPPTVLLAATAIHPVYALRYIMFCVPAAALLAGAGLASLGWAGGAAGLALIVLAALPGQTEDRRVSSHSEDLRQLSHLVATHSRPGGALLFPRLSDREFEAAYPAPYRPLRDVTLAQTPTQSATLLGTPATAQIIRHRLTGVDRLWVIETGNERGKVPLLNGLGFRVADRWTVSGIWLVLYTRPA